MGIFFNTYLYSGHFQQKTPNDSQDKNVVCFANGVIKFEDNCFLKLSKMDPILESQIKQGYVRASDIQTFLNKYFPEHKDKFDYKKDNVFICETILTTYDWPIQEQITQNLKVRL